MHRYLAGQLVDDARSGPTDVENYTTLLENVREYKVIFDEYHKGEISVQQSADRNGFVLPTVICHTAALLHSHSLTKNTLLSCHSLANTQVSFICQTRQATTKTIEWIVSCIPC